MKVLNLRKQAPLFLPAKPFLGSSQIKNFPTVLGQNSRTKNKTTEESTIKLFILDPNPNYSRKLAAVINKDKEIAAKAYPNAESFLEHVLEKPDLIFLESNMARTKVGDSDIDLFDQVKKLFPQAKIIILSSDKIFQPATYFLKNGAMDFIVKDNEFFLEELRESIDLMIQAFFLQKEIEELSATIKRDKLLLKGYSLMIIMMFTLFKLF